MILSVVVPCYNEEKTVSKFYRETLSCINKCTDLDGYEFIFVDDGSRDKTLDIIKTLRNDDINVRYVSFSRNFGKEAGIYAGLKESKGDLIVLLDADLQHPPRLFPEMINFILNEGYDSVGASRKNRDGEKLIKSFLSKAFYKFVNIISDVKIEQNSTDYRMMNRRFVDAVLSLTEYNRFTKGIFNWVGFKNKIISYENVEREDGESKWSLFGLFKYSIEGIVSFSTFPLIISSFLGIIFCIISLFMLIVFFSKTIIFKDSVRGFPTTICTMLLLGGVQLLSVGVLGQYLSKAYLEVKNRPIYIEREKSE